MMEALDDSVAEFRKCPSHSLVLWLTEDLGIR
jgi:hypothetical protein